MKNKELLDSFTWIKNNGNAPNFDYVEIILKNGNKSTGKTSGFDFSLNNDDSLLSNSDIINYREISENEAK